MCILGQLLKWGFITAWRCGVQEKARAVLTGVRLGRLLGGGKV